MKKGAATGWLVAAALAGVLAWGGAQYARLEDKTGRYATVIAACANGGSFAVGENLRVDCKAKRIVVY